MAEFANLDALFIAIAFIVPGFIFQNVRCQFITGQDRRLPESIVRYLTYGSFNFAVLSWLIYVLAATPIATPWKALLWFTVIFVAPVAAGLIAGFATQRDWSHRIFRWVGLQPVHVVPTAWDWKFGRANEQWVLITLKDGTRFAGFIGLRSFISSDGAERDIYLEKVYDLDESNNWIDIGEKSVLITHGEIRTIEFWPYRMKGSVSEQRNEDHDTSRSCRLGKGLSADANGAGRLLPEAAGRPSTSHEPGQTVIPSKSGV